MRKECKTCKWFEDSYCTRDNGTVRINPYDAACDKYDDGFATRKEMTVEATKRMKTLGIYKPIITAFRHGTVSQSLPPFGAWFFIEEGELKDKIKEIESEYGCVVYAVIPTIADFDGDRMEMISFLIVSKHKDEWEIDSRDIKDGVVFAYVWNKTWEPGSEFGSIQVKKTPAAGLIRVG